MTFLFGIYVFTRYGRIYTTAADPYHHSVGPTTTYGVGTMVSTIKTYTTTIKGHSITSVSTKGIWHLSFLVYSVENQHMLCSVYVLGQFVQRRIQPLYTLLSWPMGAKKSLSLTLGLGWSKDAAGQVMRSLSFGNMEIQCCFPIPWQSLLERLKTVRVNTVGSIRYLFYLRIHRIWWRLLSNL